MTDGRTARSQLSRQKLLEAAREEFQRNGFAGGRVDAIAEGAGVNKRMIYAYFGSKAGLLDAVVADNVARVATALPFTPDDLPGYTVRLYDFWLDDPTSMRLFSWRNVELADTPQFENAAYQAMIGAIERSGASSSSGLPPGHLLAFVFALALSWVIPSGAFDDSQSEEHRGRRSSIHTAVTRIVGEEAAHASE